MSSCARSAAEGTDPASSSTSPRSRVPAPTLSPHDGENQRISFFDLNGAFLGVVRYEPLVIAALAPDGRLAVGNGIEYCITMHVVMQRGFRRICRDRTPATVGAGIRNPDVSRSARLTALVREQRILEHLPHFDRMLFDEEGRLWVRTLGPEFLDIHPYVLEDDPELRPPYGTWDIFGELGQLLTTIEMRSTFDPQVILGRRIYEFVELLTGEVAVGVLAVAL